MENEFDKQKEKFLSEISVTKNLDDVKKFTKEIRKKLNDIIEEYRKTDERFDEELFNLETQIIANILLKSYKFEPDQDFRKLQDFYCKVLRYLFSFNKMEEVI